MVPCNGNWHYFGAVCLHKAVSIDKEATLFRPSEVIRSWPISTDTSIAIGPSRCAWCSVWSGKCANLLVTIGSQSTHVNIQ